MSLYNLVNTNIHNVTKIHNVSITFINAPTIKQFAWDVPSMVYSDSPTITQDISHGPVPISTCVHPTVSNGVTITSTSTDLACIQPSYTPQSSGAVVPSSVTDGLYTIISWVTWWVAIISIFSILIIAIRIAIVHQRGGRTQQIANLVWILSACVIAAAASGIIAAIF